MPSTTIPTSDAEGLSKAQQVFKSRILNPFLFRLYLLQKLPMAFLAGIRVRHLDRASASTSIRHGWLVQNPFRSTYFACLSMAAEMPAGLMVLMAVNGVQPRVSTLPVAMESEFVKKAVGTTTFHCENGAEIFDTVNRAIQTGEGVTIKTLSVGKNDAGEVVARFWFTWSIKQKSTR